LALARKIMPFDHDIKKNILKIACVDPSDEDLSSEIEFVTRDKKIRLYVAAEAALNAAISKYYLGEDVSLEDSGPITIQDIPAAMGIVELPGEESEKQGSCEKRKSILLVTGESSSAEHLQSLIELDGYLVFSADSPEQALGLVEDRHFHVVFINNDVPGEHIDLINRIRSLSPGTLIQYYRNASSLLIGDERLHTETELVVKNNDLVTSLLSSNAGLPANHSGLVGRYVEKLCRRLEIPESDTLLIANAAYLHDFAKYYYGLYDDRDNRHVIQLTVRLLSSIGYPPRVLDILRAMYCDISDHFEDTLPLEILGGNILTVADLYCESIPANERITMERFDLIKQRLRELKNRMVLPRVAEALIGIIQEELLDSHTRRGANQILHYTQDEKLGHALELRLKIEGYTVIGVRQIENLLKLYHRSTPDVLLLALTHDIDHGRAFIDECETRGIDFARTPCYVIINKKDISDQIDLLDRGIEDIFRHDDNFDLLITKLRRRSAPRKTHNTSDESGDSLTGARGHLADMNIIDLIQALGPGLKTVRIEVCPKIQSSGELTIYLNQGAIVYAKYQHHTGPEAIYEGLTWSEGTWVVTPLAAEEIPEPNTSVSNESILMEGCRLLDEKVRSGKLL
jgi:DNA-binding response OmpR family regulator